MEVPGGLPTASQGVLCPGGHSVHKSTLDFRKLCINGDLPGIKQFLGHRHEIQDEISSSSDTINLLFDPYNGVCAAIRSGHVQVVKYLIGNGYSLSYQGSCSLISAAVEGAASSAQTDMLDFFMEQGWDPKRSEIPGHEEYNPSRPQFSSISYGCLQFYRALLKKFRRCGTNTYLG